MINNPIDLYRLAEDEGIDVYWFPLQADCSLAIQLPDSYAIAVDPWKMDTLAKETVSLAHELGHCASGAFYNPRAALDIRQKHENRADRWAIQRLVPRDALFDAMEAGRTAVWELADLFGVTEEFMTKALHFYWHGNLAIQS